MYYVHYTVFLFIIYDTVLRIIIEPWHSVSADVDVRRVDRAVHSYYFDANDCLLELARCLPRLRLVGADKTAVRYGDFHRLVCPLMQPTGPGG